MRDILLTDEVLKARGIRVVVVGQHFYNDINGVSYTQLRTSCRDSGLINIPMETLDIPYGSKGWLLFIRDEGDIKNGRP